MMYMIEKIYFEFAPFPQRFACPGELKLPYYDQRMSQKKYGL